MQEKALAYFDGACGPKNPGGLGTWGVVLEIPGKPETVHYGIVSTSTTNNVAEWTALIMCLTLIRDSGYRGQWQVRGDSQVICRQFNREYRIQSPDLKCLADRAFSIHASIPAQIDVLWIPRGQNNLADHGTRLAIEEWKAMNSLDQAACPLSEVPVQ
jgi:ribonuclease HI